MDQGLRELSPDQLPVQFTPEEEAAIEASTEESGIFGQDRALGALRMGAEIRAKGYNIFVSGSPGTGRNSAVQAVLSQYREPIGEMKDIALVFNFKRPANPSVLCFTPGKAREFKKEIHKLVERMKSLTGQTLESDGYREQRDRMIRSLEDEENRSLAAFEAALREEGFQIAYVQDGDTQATDIVPVVNGEPSSFDQLQADMAGGRMDEETWHRMRDLYYRRMDEMKALFRELKRARADVEERLESIRTELLGPEIRAEVDSLRASFPDERVSSYLDALTDDILSNLYLFGPDQKDVDETGNPPLVRYGVNIIRDNEEGGERPVVFETYPIYKNLFGAIETRSDSAGETRTSFMMVRGGSLVRADGGFLVMQAEDLFQDQEMWAHLKRFLKTGTVEIQPEPSTHGGRNILLKPEPIPLSVKIILVGNEHLYDLLYNQDQDFQRYFKIPAEFDSVMPRTPQTIRQYASFIRKTIASEGLKEITGDGIRAIVMQGIALSEFRDKLSTRFSQIQDLLTESDYWAGRLGKERIDEESVRRALRERKLLFNLPQEKMDEMIKQGEMLISVQGKMVGRVNGLAGQDRGYFSFGSPCLITAQTGPGGEGIINIEREVGLSGEIHDKGILILEGYLRATYARSFPLSMFASLCFEQSYSEVDGDSASSTELYALLSSISGLPLRQDIGATGSVNQMGEIQPVGGIAEKIEGFYETCRKISYTGTQGVLLPHQNVQNIILPPEILREVREGRFHLWAVRTIDEGMEILTGLPAGERNRKGVFPPGTVNYMVERRLREMADMVKAYGGS